MEEPVANAPLKKKVRTDRLLKLADFLETLPPAVFDLSEWETNPATKPEGEKQGDCGFAGCAVGWAVHAKLFDGFEFVAGRGFSGHTVAAPGYGGKRGWSAVNSVFDIEDPDSFHLFAVVAYGDNPTPVTVAERIRQFVSKAESA